MKKIILFLSIVLILAVISITFIRYNDNPISIQPNKEILTYFGIDSVLNTMKKIPYSNIEKKFIDLFGYNGMYYESQVKNKYFYKVTNKDINKILVGNFPIWTFLPYDDITKKLINSPDVEGYQYMLIDKNVLDCFLDLILKLDKLGYDKYAFYVRDGFRYPKFNSETHGALYSQHLFGTAIDIKIGDINKDGIADETTDKKIVLDILDMEIIKSKGGIGRYPKSLVVHFDTRGSWARWDSY